MRPRLLDLFCGAGGAAKGYQLAGFYVVGVDIKPQPHYCGDEFAQADALDFLRVYSAQFDAIHASPPCQAFTGMSNRHRGEGGLADEQPDLLTPTLALLRGRSIPWVVENVPGSSPPLRPVLALHGGMFGLGVHRRRLFESNVLLMASRHPPSPDCVGVYGKAPDGRQLWKEYRAASSLTEAQEAMGMDWADWHGTKEAIPPAYTEWIGVQLIQQVEKSA